MGEDVWQDGALLSSGLSYVVDSDPVVDDSDDDEVDEDRPYWEMETILEREEEEAGQEAGEGRQLG